MRNYLKMIFFIVLFLLLSTPIISQNYTKFDTLRGSLLPERMWYDVNYYHLSIDVNPIFKSISGSNDIFFSVIENSSKMQLDLFENMLIDSIIFRGEEVLFSRNKDVIYIYFPEDFSIGDQAYISVYYQGVPLESNNPPWDGGFVWETDNSGHPWIGVACQGLGASSWWPCKDHLSDEPDSMRITCSVPSEVQFVGNGNIETDTILFDKRISTWKVSYPINNYNVTLNIGNYSHLHDEYISYSDTLSLDYYVLEGNEEKASIQFKQVKPMLYVFEELFGPYPFWNDGYALVETPYVGMEHQSAIAYGNQYMQGYLGRYPKNMDFDFILIHESGHEYWGNSISMNDIADMWIHESFCTYSEALYVEKIYGNEQMILYLMYQRDFINGTSPILGYRDVNQKGNSTDMYYKGSWMLHSIRQTLSNDSLWFSILKDISQKFALKNCDGEEIISFICDRSGIDFRPIFNQYLNYTTLPVLQYKIKKAKGIYKLFYNWLTDVDAFNMPVDISISEVEIIRIFPTIQKQSILLNIDSPNQLNFIDKHFLYEKIEE